MKHTIKIIIIFLLSGNLFSQSIPTLRFRKPTTTDNITWKFTSVLSGVDAFITVIGSKNATLDAIDDSTQYAYAWQPFIKVKNKANASDSSYVNFRIDFKRASNGANQVMSNMAMTIVDLDGSGIGSYREMVSSSLPATPKGILGSLLSTVLGTNSLTALSGVISYSKTDTTNYAGMLQMNYNNISSYTMKVGVVGNAPASTVRQFSFYYKAFASMVTVLPVKLIDFKAVSNNEVPVVSWTTTMEENAKHFEIYRSLDGINYTLVSTLEAKGNSQTISNYTFADNNLYGQSQANVFYKLKLVDNNGAFNWTSIVHFSQNLESNNTAIASIYPNPSKGIININFSSISENDFSLELVDIYGNVHHSLNNIDINGQYSVSVDFSDLANGVYFVKLNENGKTSTTKIIKN